MDGAITPIYSKHSTPLSNIINAKVNNLCKQYQYTRYDEYDS